MLLENGESDLDRQRGGKDGSQQNHQDSDVGSSHESEALVTAATVQGILNLMVESNPTTVDSETDQAAGGVVSFLNVGKKKSYSP